MPTLLRIWTGAMVWAAHFAAIYGGTALACARGEVRAVPWILALSTLLGVALAAAIIARCYPRRDDFAHWMAAAVAGIAAIAMIWEAMAGLTARTCA